MTVYGPGSRRAGFARAHRRVDRVGAHRGDVHPAEIVVHGAGPAAAGAVRRARGDGVEHRARAVVDEETLAVAEGGEAVADVEKAGGLEVLAGRLLEHRRHRGGELVRRRVLRRGGEAAAGDVLLRADRRHELGILRRELRDLLGLRDEGGERVVAQVSAGGAAGAQAKVRLDADVERTGRAAGRRHVLRKADVALLGAIEADAARLGLRQREDLLRDAAGIVLAQDHAMSFRSVLRTLTRRKRAGTAPCETGAVCSGWPLPQLGAPPRK